MSWHNLAVELYYNDGLNIVEIAEEVDKSKQAISKFLSKQDPRRYAQEKEKRKMANQEKERERKREWKRRNGKNEYAESMIIKKQHIIDVIVLSADRY